MYKLILILALIASFAGCAKFKEGDCIQDTEDGYIWRITKVGGSEYTMQGWLAGKWGLAVNRSFGTYDSRDSRYVKISCPFSTQTLQEGK